MVKIATALNCQITISLQPLTSTTTATLRTKVSYRDKTPLHSHILNDKPKT